MPLLGPVLDGLASWARLRWPCPYCSEPGADARHTYLCRVMRERCAACGEGDAVLEVTAGGTLVYNGARMVEVLATASTTSVPVRVVRGEGGR